MGDAEVSKDEAAAEMIHSDTSNESESFFSGVKIPKSGEDWKVLRQTDEEKSRKRRVYCSTSDLALSDLHH